MKGRARYISMKALAIDTSTKVLSIAVLTDDGLRAELNYSFKELRYNSVLVPFIEMLLSSVKLNLSDIDIFCVSIGPGSFTGLRIGVSVIKALALATCREVTAVPTLDVLAMNVFSYNRLIVPIVDAKRDNVYTCTYKYLKNGRLKRIGKYSLISRFELRKRIRKGAILLGDGLDVCSLERGCYELMGERFWYPKALNVARLGIEMCRCGKITRPEEIAPFYIYPEDVQCRGK